MKIIIFTALMLAVCFSNMALAEKLTAHFRDRPPEMVVKDGSVSGPLIDILNTAAERSGATIDWHQVPFKRSMEQLKVGKLDLLPRVLYRESRAEFVHYLDPIGVQEKSISFVIPKGKEGTVASYDDLYKVKVGVKRGTAYFSKFDKDAKINKLESVDDTNLAKMFKASRFDTVAVLDKASLEEELAKIGVANVSYADYRFDQRIENQYGSSKKLYEGGKKSIYDSINSELAKMVSSGEIDEFYKKYNIEPPSHY